MHSVLCFNMRACVQTSEIQFPVLLRAVTHALHLNVRQALYIYT